MLVAHLGSVHPKELTREPLEPTERFYPNHLGVLGTVGVIHRMQPRLALISEFGEEMRHVRSRVVAGIGHACSSQANPGGQQAERPAVLPADLPLILDLADLRIYCVDTRRMEPFVDVKFCPHGGMFYYIRSRQSGHNVDMDDCVTAYEETLGLGYAGNRRPPHLLAS